jgi:hypothetical protein
VDVGVTGVKGEFGILLLLFSARGVNDTIFRVDFLVIESPTIGDKVVFLVGVLFFLEGEMIPITELTVPLLLYKVVVENKY